jgi:hypothetical protein
MAAGVLLLTSPGEEETPIFPKGEDYVFDELIYMTR